LRTEPFPEPLRPVMSTNCLVRFLAAGLFFMKVPVVSRQGDYEL
jgi:hypothetical protein